MMLWRGLGAALLAAVAVGALGGLAWLGTWPPMTTVESDSMRPTLDAGDLLLLRGTGEVQVGDVVVVPVPGPLQVERGYPERLAHRVVAVEDGRVITQGDRHDQPDPFTVPVEAVGQRAVAAVPFAGHALAFLRSPVGMIWLVGGLVLLAVRQRQPKDESAAATVADLQALRADLVELLSVPQGQNADADAGVPAALGEETPAAQEASPPPRSEPSQRPPRRSPRTCRSRPRTAGPRPCARPQVAAQRCARPRRARSHAGPSQSLPGHGRASQMRTTRRPSAAPDGSACASREVRGGKGLARPDRVAAHESGGGLGGWP